MGGALEGIKVVDLSRMLPGPYCSMIMADHGARVIAIEDRRFIADDLYIFPVNRNKDHMTLNLKTKEGHEIFFKLIKDADVLIEGFRPGVTKRLDIDYDTVKKANKKVIYCSITGYGQDGPYKDMAGHDVNYLSFAGILDTIGEKDRTPCIPGIQIADLAGGAMNAAIGILLALYARERTGQGQYIDISMTDGLVAMLSGALDLFQKNGEIPERSNHLLSHRYACYNVYETADGRYISIGALENRFWKNLCTVLEAPEYIELEYDDSHREEIIDAFRKIFKRKTLKQWKAEFTGKDVCWGEVKKLDEIFDDPLFLAREMVCNIEDNKGEPVRALGIPVKLSDTPGSIRTGPVGFGESTEKVLYELGYSKKDIEEFFEKGVV
jgi:crotonobetainyl-CoA:carnitine CoA-transferase CaiB-like acyl-CoA transferase